MTTPRVFFPIIMSSVKRPKQVREGLVFISSTLRRTPSDPPHPEPKQRRENFPPPSVVPRVLILSDTYVTKSLPGRVFESIDVVLHCGDISESGVLETHHNTIALLSSNRRPSRARHPRKPRHQSR